MPEWARELARHYWCIRNARASDRPSLRTRYRRLADEKKRLRDAGVDPFELHLVCFMLRKARDPAHVERIAARLAKRQQAEAA